MRLSWEGPEKKVHVSFNSESERGLLSDAIMPHLGRVAGWGFKLGLLVNRDLDRRPVTLGLGRSRLVDLTEDVRNLAEETTPQAWAGIIPRDMAVAVEDAAGELTHFIDGTVEGQSLPDWPYLQWIEEYTKPKPSPDLSVIGEEAQIS